MRVRWWGAVLGLLLGAWHAVAVAQQVPTIRVSAFNAPSLGSYVPPIIRARGLDRANGFTLEMAYKPSDTYQVDFASGQDQVGGSSTFISEARRVSQGVDVVCLFTVFDYFGALITSNPQIKSFKDLEGRELAADTPTTLWAMGQWFLTRSGTDLGKVRVVSQGAPAMVVSIQAGRADAVFVSEPTYSVIMRGPNAGQLRSVVADNALWKQLTGLPTLPLLGVSAHRGWLTRHRDQAQALYTAYKQAADWAIANPADAARIIAEATRLSPVPLEDALRSGRLGLRVQPAVGGKDTIMAALQLAVQTKQVEKVPPPDTFFYTGLR